MFIDAKFSLCNNKSMLCWTPSAEAHSKCVAHFVVLVFLLTFTSELIRICKHSKFLYSCTNCKKRKTQQQQKIHGQDRDTDYWYKTLVK